MKNLKYLLAILMASIFTSCDSKFYDIPPGYVGMILTSKGWSNQILEAGQVNLGTNDIDGEKNQLTLLEATSVSVKESFLDGSGEDNRVKIGGLPATADVYVRMIVPKNKEARLSIFSQITANSTNDNVSTIKLEDIYNRLAKMDVRSSIRQVFSKYNSVDDVIANQEIVSDSIAVRIVRHFERTGVPLILQNVSISNVREDSSLIASKNAVSAANSEVEKIKAIGAAIRENPGYLEAKRLEVYEHIAGKGTTFVISEGGSPVLVGNK